MYKEIGTVNAMMNDATDLKTSDVRELFQEGERLFNGNNISKAGVCFERIIATDPQHYEAFNNLGVIHFREGHLQQAIHFFHKALEVNEEYAESLFA
jgi:tetratricopeptide (TPR) repeat protein